MEAHAITTTAVTDAKLATSKIAYSISERNGRSFWTRIGRAFVNRDGSINVRLEALPTNGQIQLRDPEPRDELGGPSIARARPDGKKDDVLAELPF